MYSGVLARKYFLYTFYTILFVPISSGSLRTNLSYVSFISIQSLSTPFITLSSSHAWLGRTLLLVDRYKYCIHVCENFSLIINYDFLLPSQLPDFLLSVSFPSSSSQTSFPHLQHLPLSTPSQIEVHCVARRWSITSPKPHPRPSQLGRDSIIRLN